MASSLESMMRYLMIGVMALMVWGATPSWAHDQTRIYSFGVVPQFEPRKLAAIWRPILTEVEKLTGLHLHMTGSPDINEFERGFLRGDFDFAYMNPYHAVLAAKHQGYLPILRDHGRKLSGVLVVAKDSPITHIKELQGQTIAFPSPNALGASLLMRYELAEQHGLTVEPLYVKTHSSVYLHVALGQAVAGGGVLGTLKRQKPAVKSRLKVFYTTRKMPPHPITAHKRISPKVRQQIQQAFLKLGQSKKGQAMLANIPMKRMGVAAQKDYAVLNDWQLEHYYVAAQ
ncbi:phosphate/phosphite/phosphonate ABC transporter substrate-binding protein [Magnetococcus sp. PR-3]|uniref:phosphate/phosphite/phosphonate ABC transporter substrate-binding protein n=1 Tax=Magnetococcus sp. PR-3 TaxID=3120355 RepID=UPI002FCE2E23